MMAIAPPVDDRGGLGEPHITNTEGSSSSLSVEVDAHINAVFQLSVEQPSLSTLSISGTCSPKGVVSDFRFRI